MGGGGGGGRGDARGRDGRAGFTFKTAYFFGSIKIFGIFRVLLVSKYPKNTENFDRQLQLQ